VAVSAKPSTASAADGILYVQASSRERPAVRDRLARLGVPVTVADDIADAARAVSEHHFGLAVIDLAGDRGAISAIRFLRAAQPALPLACVVNPANPLAAADALHAGVVDLMPWPFDDSDVVAALVNARDRSALDARGLGANASSGGLFVQSAAMRQVLDAVRAAAVVRRSLIVCGEPGSGRAFVARAIHTLAGTHGDFVRVDCSMPPGELEHVLFGTAARIDDGRSAGAERVTAESAVHRAHGGTLFLANLTEAPARIQVRLSRLLRDREAHVDDRDRAKDLDVRTIIAVEPDMDAAIADGRIRRDLIDRFIPPRIDVPPLNRRREDIPLLAVHFMRRAAEERGVAARTFSRASLSVMSALPWHGNARELRDLVDRLSHSIARPVVQLDDVLDHVRLDGLSSRIDSGISLRDAKARFERECITAVLIRHHGRVGEAAKALGIQRTNLYRKVRQLNVARSLLSARR
jgi:DNA-binding NtrC family response regulator